MSPCRAEPLEGRRHLAVSAGLVLGPTEVGYAANYTLTDTNGVSVSMRRTVVGPDTFEGKNAITIRNEVWAGGRRVTSTFEYFQSSLSTGLFSLGTDDYSFNQDGTTDRTYTVHVPGARYLSASITAAQGAQTSTWKENSTWIPGDGSDRAYESISVDYSIRLASDTPSSITVPAGTFARCYRFTIQETSTSAATSDEWRDYTDMWVMEGVGLVKSVSTTTQLGAAFGNTVVLSSVASPAQGALAFGVQPTNAAAGATLTPAPAVRVLTDAGVLDTADNATTVTLRVLTGPAGTVNTVAGTARAVRGVATFSSLKFNTPGTYKLVASAASGQITLSAASNTFTIGAASKLTALTPTTNAVAGQAIAPVRIALQTAAGQTVPIATNSVTLSVQSAPTGAKPITGTLTRPAVAGVATFGDLKLTTAGTYTLRVASGTLTPTTVKIVVSAAAASKLTFSAIPTSAVAGAAFAASVRVTDAFGNLVTTPPATVSLAIATGPAGGSFSPVPAPKSATGGTANFTGLVLRKAGAYTLRASVGAVTVVSSTLTIRPATASRMAIVTQPTTGKVNVSLAPALAIQLLDAFGNRVASSAAVSIAILSGPAGATLAGTTSKNAVSGLATFSALRLNKVGRYVLRISTAGLSSVSTAAINIA